MLRRQKNRKQAPTRRYAVVSRSVFLISGQYQLEIGQAIKRLRREAREAKILLANEKAQGHVGLMRNTTDINVHSGSQLTGKPFMNPLRTTQLTLC